MQLREEKDSAKDEIRELLNLNVYETVDSRRNDIIKKKSRLSRLFFTFL